MFGMPLGFRAQSLARRFGISDRRVVWGAGRNPNDGLLRIEDGFIRSIAPGRHDVQLSICFDDLGIYYDARNPSRFQSLISERQIEFGSPNYSTAKLSRAQALAKHWRESRVSKYNDGREIDPPEDPFVLVIDQTLGDRSITGGLANSASFNRMVDAALSDYPHHKVIIKIHPDVAIGKKKGIIDLAKFKNEDRVEIVDGSFHPVSLIEAADAVFVVTSQVGFEALIWGKTTRIFGMPFYGGLGLTHDDISSPIRRPSTCLEALVYVSLVDYVIYRDPEMNCLTSPERVIEWVGLQRSNRERFPTQVRLHNISWRKKKVLRVFLQGSKLATYSDLKSIEGTSVRCSLVWGGNTPSRPGTLKAEDGFIRSKGLAPDQYFPFSLAIDALGIHYDPTQPSELEEIIKKKDDVLPLIERAKKLRELIVQNGVTKYNLSEKQWYRPEGKNNVILVVGQVPSDASIKLGAIDIKTDFELLNEIRHHRPDAYLVYKPHPDIEAGIRKKHDHSGSIRLLADEILFGVDLNHLFSQIDELHSITSLTGFEALLRGVKTFCYGLPFYAGWGLTVDRHPCDRRNIKLTIDELVAAALIKYPIYIDKKTGRYTTPETIINRILQKRKNEKLLAHQKLARFLTGIYNLHKIDS